MESRSKSPTKHKRGTLPKASKHAQTSGITHTLLHGVKQCWAWLLKHLDATYVVAGGLIVVGAVIFFAAQRASWLQGAGGVIVGTGFTVLITIVTGQRAIHEQYAKEANLRRKDVLYGPLYTELQNLREILQEAHNNGGWYPLRIQISDGEQANHSIAPPGYAIPTLVQWPAFRQGYYWSDFTASARRILDRLNDLAEAYNPAVRNAVAPTTEVLSHEIELAIQQVKTSDEYTLWLKKARPELRMNRNMSDLSWYEQLYFFPQSGTTQSQAQEWAGSWIQFWPIKKEPPAKGYFYQEPPLLGYLLAGNADTAVQWIHSNDQWLHSNDDPTLPLEWIKGVVESAISELQTQHAYHEARKARDQLYSAVQEAEQMLLRALNEIQRRYEGGRPPL